MPTDSRPPLRLIVLGSAVCRPGSMDGACRILLELVKKWADQGLVQATIITSAERRETCAAYGLKENVDYILWPDAPGVWSMLGHLRAAWRWRRRAGRLDLPRDDRPALLYSASDFLPDVLAATRLRKRFPWLTWVASRFLFVPHPLKGWKHAYDPGLHLPDVKLVLGKGYQELAFASIRRADYFFITNEVDRPYLTTRGIPAERIKPIYGGVHFDEISRTPPQPFRYDGCFCGRISPQKGVLDLVDIWGRVCARKPDARLAVIGVGHKPFEDELRESIRRRGLESRVEWLGFLDGEAKHRVYRASRVFLHTSVYDNYGMAACEAMAAGVPAAMYDLPPLRVAYPQGCVKARRNDPQHFADEVLGVLHDEARWRRLSEEATAWARSQDWGAKAAEVMQFLRAGAAWGAGDADRAGDAGPGSGSDRRHGNLRSPAAERAGPP